MTELSLVGKRVQDLGLSKFDVFASPAQTEQQDTSLFNLASSIIEESPPIKIGKGAVQIGYNLINDDSPKIDAFEKWKSSGLSDTYFDQAMNVSTENEWQQFIQDTKKEEKNNTVVSNYGLAGTAAKFVANVALDPTTYATFGLGSMLKAGMSTPAAFAISGASGGAAYTGQQKIMNQYDDVSADLIINPMAGAIVGGLLGKGIDTFSNLRKKNIVKKDFQQLSNAVLSETKSPITPQSVGAAVVDKSDYRIGGNIVSRALNKAVSIVSPRARGQAATSKTTAELYGKMMGTSAKTKSNMEELVASKTSFGEETEKLRQQMVGRMRQSSDNLSSLAKAGHKIDETKFDEAARIMWSGENPDLDSIDPVIREILDLHGEYLNLKNLMIAERVPNFTSRKDYGVPVIISPSKATQKIDDLVERNVARIKEKQATAAQRIDQIQNHIDDLLKNYSRENISEPLSRMEEELDLLKNLSRASDDEIRDDAILMAQQMADGRSNEIHMLPPDQAKKLKPKFFDSRYINPLDYLDVLETNPYVLMGRYIDEVSPHIAFNRVFPEQKITSVVEDYKNKMTNEINDAITSGNKKLADKLTKESNTAIADIMNAFDTETGMYAAKAVAQVGDFAPYLNAMSNITNITMLGGQVMGSVSEVAAIALHHGLGSAGLQVSKALAAFASDLSIASVARKEAGYAGVGLELAKNKLLNDILSNEILSAEIGGKVGKVIHKGNVLFQRANLSVYYDTINRTASFIVQQGVMKERLSKFSKLSKEELADLAYLGIDKSNYQKIVDQLKKYGNDTQGVFFSNADQWDDISARETWINAIRKDNRRTSVQVDLGDTPFFFRTPIGKNMFKFKSWSIAATQKYLIQSSQKGVGALPAIGAMVAFSGAVDYLYNKSQGKEVSTDPDELLWAGINRSGILGVLPEVGGSALVNNLAGIKSGGARVYDYNSAASILAGPTGSMAEDIFNVLPIPKMQDDGTYSAPYTNKKGELKESSVNSFIDLMPLPLVKPYLKGYGTPFLINETE